MVVVVASVLGCASAGAPDGVAVDAAHDQGYSDGFDAGQEACGEVALGDLSDKAKQEEWAKLPCIRLVGEVAVSGPAKVSMAATQDETPAVKAARKAAKDAGGKEVSGKVELRKKSAASIESAAKAALLSKAQFLGYNRVVEAIIKVDCGSAKCTADASGVAVK